MTGVEWSAHSLLFAATLYLHKVSPMPLNLMTMALPEHTYQLTWLGPSRGWVWGEEARALQKRPRANGHGVFGLNARGMTITQCLIEDVGVGVEIEGEANEITHSRISSGRAGNGVVGARLTGDKETGGMQGKSTYQPQTTTRKTGR
jgi:hypothetical protein